MNTQSSISKFQKNILEWFAKNGRHDLPWRHTTNPYRILVSEIMLQQTQVDRVISYYKTFLKRFPTARKLANASPAEVLRVWKGLGYNRRALYLKRAAEKIIDDYNGQFPREVSEIEKLPGVGHYTARAVAVFAFNTPEVFIETNIRRVFIWKMGKMVSSPHFARSGDGSSQNTDLTPFSIPDSDLIPIIEKALYRKNPRLWYNALMDYGALALSDIPNPNRQSRHYTKQSRFEGSRRYARAKILDALLKGSALSQAELQKYYLADIFFEPYRERTVFAGILSDLECEGFIERKRLRWRLRKS
jgi:A/G-specific adenine glycosylase